MIATPSASALAHRPATFQSLAEALDYAAQGQTGVNFYDAGPTLTASLTYADLRDQAMALAGRLAHHVPRGGHIGLIAETSPDFVVAFMACQYAGLVAVPMALPAAFGGREAYSWQIAKIIETAGLDMLMSPTGLRAMIDEIVAERGVPHFDLNGSDLGADTAETIPLGPDEPAYIQFSSGSTSAPKGVYATQASLMANTHAITNEGLRIGPNDRMATWLPFYHDMGLVGFFVVPLCTQTSLDCISPSTFARRPGLWLQVISENRGTITYSPSFGYGLAARRHRGETFDLSSLRVAGIGGDMIEPDVLTRFGEVFAPFGFNTDAFVASYGMAEVALAVSFAPLMTGPRFDTTNLHVLQAQSLARAPKGPHEKQRVFTSCGVPLPSLGVQIRTQAGQMAGPGEIGEVMLSGPSLADGYYCAGQPLRPLAGPDGWYATGDLGYWLGDEIVISGRSKDVMLWNGKNIWPQDLEWVAQKAGGRPVGRAAAFDFEKDDGSSQVMLLVECGLRDAEERERIKREIVNAVRNVVGVPFQFGFVAMRSLPVTSSGKLSRAHTRIRYLSGQLTDPVANAADAPQSKPVPASAG